VYYRRPAHQQPAMHEFATTKPLPGTDDAARRHLALPISAALDELQAAEVVAAVRETLG
jgi:dTDP-4-amino-4,6-dideoxygalactose transaminase